MMLDEFYPPTPATGPDHQPTRPEHSIGTGMEGERAPDHTNSPDDVPLLARLVRPYVKRSGRGGKRDADSAPAARRRKETDEDSKARVADPGEAADQARPLPGVTLDPEPGVTQQPGPDPGELTQPRSKSIYSRNWRGLTMSKQEDLTRVIYEMRRSIPELHGVMIASTDGLPVAHDFPDSEAERVAAMAATALGLGKRMTERTNMGALHETVVRGDHGYVVVYAAGENAVLVMSGPITSNLGLMRIEARTASAAVSQVLR